MRLYTHYERIHHGDWTILPFTAVQSRAYPTMDWYEGYYSQDAQALINAWNQQSIDIESDLRYRLVEPASMQGGHYIADVRMVAVAINDRPCNVIRATLYNRRCQVLLMQVSLSDIEQYLQNEYRKSSD